MIKIIKENLVIRGYKSGDFIYIRAGKKAIKKLFTDEKILEHKNDRFDLVMIISPTPTPEPAAAPHLSTTGATASS